MIVCISNLFKRKMMSLFTLLFLVSPLSIEVSYAQKGGSSRGKSSSQHEATLKSLEPKVIGAERELEERARTILSSQLDSPYSLFVKITIDEKRFKQKLTLIESQDQLRTLPTSTSGGVGLYIRSLTVEDVFSLIKKIKVSVTIDKSLPDDQVQVIKKTITGALNLNTSRGDQLEVDRSDMISASFKSKQEAFNREAQSASFQTKRMELMLKELELKNKQLSSSGQNNGSESSLALEVRKIAEDVRLLRTENEKQSQSDQRILSEKLSQLEKIAESIRGNGSGKDGTQSGSDGSDFLGGIKKKISGLELPITLLPIAVLLALVLLKMANGQTQTAGALRSGMEELGKSVKAMAETLAGAAKNISASAAAGAEQDKTSEKDSSTANAQTSSEGGSLELLQADAINTWSKTVEMPYYLLSILKEWLVLPENREKFLQVTEAVGAESAAWIWSKFPSEEVEQLGALLNKPMPKASSFSVMSLLYRAIVREAGAKPQYLSGMGDLEFLVSLTDQKLRDILLDSSEEEIVAVLSVLTSTRAARIINLLGERVTAEIFRGMELAANSNPQEIERHLANIKAKSDQSLSSFSTGLLGCLVRILESQDSSAQGAAKSYLNENLVMATEVRKRVITFDDVMTLDQDSQYELFGSLSPTDVANLISNMNTENRGKVAKFFSGKAKAQIDDELKKLEGKKQLKKRAAIQGERIKANILRKVRIMRDQGLIEFESAQKETPAEVPTQKAS